MARTWRHVNQAGLPTYAHDAEALANAILGEDMLMVVPKHESIWYRKGEHFGHWITTCVHLDEGNREELVAKIDWQPIDAPKLKR